MNLPLLLVASVIPDIDLLLRFLMHRGPTHSLITLTVLMIPFFVVYRKRVIPYFAALLSHVLIGDFFGGGIELLWPLTQNWFGAINFSVASSINMIAELSLFCLAVPIMFKLGDLKSLLKPHNKTVQHHSPVHSFASQRSGTHVVNVPNGLQKRDSGKISACRFKFNYSK